MNRSTKQERGATIFETCESMNQRLHPLALNQGQWKTVKGLTRLDDNPVGRLNGKQTSKNLGTIVLSIHSFSDSILIQTEEQLTLYEQKELDPVIYPSFSIPKDTWYFVYDSAGDENGLFFWLGTSGYTTSWTNPSPSKATISANLIDRTSTGIDIPSPHTWELKNKYYFELREILIRGDSSSSSDFAITAKNINTGTEIKILDLTGLDFSLNEWQVFEIQETLKTPASEYTFSSTTNLKFLEIEFYGKLYLDVVNISTANDFNNSINPIDWIEDGILVSDVNEIGLNKSLATDFSSEKPVEFTSSTDWIEENALYLSTDVDDRLFFFQAAFNNGLNFETNQVTVSLTELAL